MTALLSLLLACASLAASKPVGPRTVASLDEASFAEAQQRDGTASRAFSNVQIKTSDGRCLFVDKLSGDFLANLTPIQVGTCGGTDGHGWDIITKGKHIDVANSMLIVSTFTNACVNFDPRRAAGNQVNLFSCGGRADGGGAVTNSQLFTFNGGSGPLSFQPENQAGSCFTVKGNVVDIAKCDSSDANQSFTFGGAASAGGNGNGNGAASGKTTAAATSTAKTAATATTTSIKETDASIDTTAVASSSPSTCTRITRTVKVKPGNQDVTTAAPSSGSDETASATEETASATTTASSSSESSSSSSGGAVTTNVPVTAIANPTTPVPVSRAGGTLNPSAAAQSNERDGTAVRAFSDVEIRAPNGQCMFVDPTAGDFRQNLIPIALVDCAGTPNERWDVVTKGKHNNAQNAAIIVSSVTGGCISLDPRHAAGDTVTIFSCGGRADGQGETNADQLMPYIGELSFAFSPEGENNKTCILPGDNGRLDSGPCPDHLGPQLYSIFP